MPIGLSHVNAVTRRAVISAMLVVASVDPTALDDRDENLVRGTEWLNSVSGDYFKSSDDTPSAAVWVPISGGGAGPPGPAGPDGPTGPQGGAGPPGLQGDDGADGLMGPPGPTGPQGPAGADGGTGPTGPQGLAGVPGLQGDDGADGMAGPPGVAGVAGATGATGAQGLQGVPGLQGNDGDDGAQGPPGIAGVAGATGADGAVGPQGPKGDPGPAGEDGADGPMGPPGPTGATGPQGTPGAGGATVGTTTVDFGAFPGTSDTSATVTGQAGILAGSVVSAWIRPVDTADHTADEHWASNIVVVAGNIVPGTGFTIYARNNDMMTALPGASPQRNGRGNGDGGTRQYGLFTVAWSWS